MTKKDEEKEEKAAAKAEKKAAKTVVKQEGIREREARRAEKPIEEEGEPLPDGAGNPVIDGISVPKEEA